MGHIRSVISMQQALASATVCSHLVVDAMSLLHEDYCRPLKRWTHSKNRHDKNLETSKFSHIRMTCLLIDTIIAKPILRGPQTCTERHLNPQPLAR